MRGKAPPYKIAVANMRITPAYAGKSLTEKRKAAFGKDHPRLCGEKCYSCRAADPVFGITPAYAGKRAFSGRIRKAA